MGRITDPKQMETYSSPEQIAEVAYDVGRHNSRENGFYSII